MLAASTFVRSKPNIFWKFLPFWFFLIFFKFGASLHYTIISPLGEKLLPLWLVGLLIGGGALVQLLLDVPAGHLLDRYGYRRFLKIATINFFIAAVCFAFPLTRATYLLSLFFATFGWLFFGPGINAYILSHAPQTHAGKFISLRDVFGSVGVVLASMALPFVLIFSPQYTGFILSILFLLALIAIFFSPKDHQSVHAEIKLETQHHYIHRHYLGTTLRAIKKLNPASAMLLLLNFSASFFYGIIWFVVPLVIVHQANAGLLSVGLGMFDFAIVVLGFIFGKLADTANRRTLIFFGLLLFSLSGMFLGFNFSWLFLLFGFLSTSGDEMASISLWSWLHKLDKNHANNGVIAGVINLSDDFGWMVGPAAAGLLYGLVGPSWAILIGAVPIFLTWIIYQFMVRGQTLAIVNLNQIPAKPHRARHKM